MIVGLPRFLVDASVAVMWHMPAEPNAPKALELLRDWQYNAVKLYITDQFSSEVANAFLQASRRNRLTQPAALLALQQILALQLSSFRTTNSVVLRTWEIAAAYNQRVYDCIYIAIAERNRLDFWTDDQRLLNSLSSGYPFVRWIAQYQRKRP